MSRDTQFQKRLCADISSEGKINFTDTNERVGLERKQLKGSFIGRDKDQLGSYVKDLEKTLGINKEIISELVSSAPGDAGMKRAMEKLNQENAELHRQFSKISKERDDSQAKLLICEQIIDELNNKYDESTKEYEEKQKELLDQLSRKEYAVQQQERRYQKIEELLMKRAHNDQEIGKAVKSLNLHMDAPKRIVNVIEENDELARKLHESQQTVADLQERLGDLTKLSQRQTELIEELKRREAPVAVRCPTLAGGNGTTVPPLDFSKLDQYSGKKTNNATYIHKLEESIKTLNAELEVAKTQNAVLMEKKSHLEDELEKLFKINERLSAALREANSKLDACVRLSASSGKKNRFNSTCQRPLEGCNFALGLNTSMQNIVSSSSKDTRRKQWAAQCSVMLDSTGRNMTEPNAVLGKRTSEDKVITCSGRKEATAGESHKSDPMNKSFGEISSIEEVIDSPGRRVDLQAAAGEK